jgi:ATP-binding cassette subfamily F protein 3
MEALSTKTLELSPGTGPSDPARVKLFYGNYAYYLEKINGNIADDDNNVNIINNISVDDNCTANKTAAELRQYNKQYQTTIRRLQRQEAEVLSAIEKLESERAHWEAELSRPEVYSNGEKAKAAKQKLDEAAAHIKTKTAEWEALAAQLEAAQSGK